MSKKPKNDTWWGNAYKNIEQQEKQILQIKLWISQGVVKIICG
jgi:hypothetical protein